MEIIEVDYGASAHDHLRESGEEHEGLSSFARYHVGEHRKIMQSLLSEAWRGGFNVVGPMPNTVKGLTTAEKVLSYSAIARSLVPLGQKMDFVRFVMLTEHTTETMIDECINAGIVDAKVYPFGRTTLSQNGVVNYGRLLPIIKYCGEVGMKVHFHPEHPESLFNSRDAEFLFLPIVYMFLQETSATIIWEHGTDARCIPHWKKMADTGRFYLSLTAHHLATHEDDVFGEVDAVCKPPIKTQEDREHLVRLVKEDNDWVMAGPDSAMHKADTKYKKEGRCSCGAFTAPFLLPLYAHALDDLLDTSEGQHIFMNFTNRNLRDLHKLEPSQGKIKLIRSDWQIPSFYKIGSHKVVPFWAGRRIKWQTLTS